MGATDSERFDVYFRGECLDGADVQAVRAALGRLFRADPATLEKLFSGELQRIKRGVDRPTAEKYRAAMEAAGARAIIRAGGGAASADPSPAAAPARSETETGPPAHDFELDAIGSDMLRPEERPRHDAPVPATDHLDLAAPGETLGIEPEPVPTVPAPDYDVAEIGSELSKATPQAATAPPDTSDITLAAPEHDLSDCAPADADAPPPAVDHLSMAEAGDALIDEHERKRTEAVAPATDHLSLAPGADAGGADKANAGNPFDRQ